MSMDIHLPILLVEDNASDVELTRRAFRKSEIQNELVIARDGSEALQILHGDQGNTPFEPTLVLLDLKLPKLSGIEVLRAIRAEKNTRRLTVVMLTSSVEERDLIACYDSGANSYIRKPVDFNQFADAIRLIGHYWLGLNQSPPLAHD